MRVTVAGGTSKSTETMRARRVRRAPDEAVGVGATLERPPVDDLVRVGVRLALRQCPAQPDLEDGDIALREDPSADELAAEQRGELEVGRRGRGVTALHVEDPGSSPSATAAMPLWPPV